MLSFEQLLTEGWKIHQQGDRTAARQMYEQAIAMNPQHGAGWCYLGIALYDDKRFEEAEEAYRKALSFNDKSAIYHNNLANCLNMLKRFDEAAAEFDISMQLDPKYANPYRNKGSMVYWQGKVQESIELFEKSIEIDPAKAETRTNLGIALLLTGQFERGWKEYAYRLQGPGFPQPSWPQPMWNGDSLNGRTILITTEQGIGDTVNFIRYGQRLKELYNCRVLALVHAKVLPILRECPGIDGYCCTNAKTLPPFDVYSPMLELPRLLRDDLSRRDWKIPYIGTLPSMIDEWGRELAKYPAGFRVGLAWQGNPQHKADHIRSFALTAMLPLAQVPNVTFFSLQKGPGSEQVPMLADQFPIVDIGPKLDEKTGAFMETIAVMKQLNLVITLDSAAAHVAGAAGVPVWVALSHTPDWRWQMDRSDTNWYPTMKLFRKRIGGNWREIFERMAVELKDLATK